MKLPDDFSHELPMRVVAPPVDTSLERPIEAAAVTPSFEAIYDRYFDEVERWLRAMGVPSAELEDLGQEVFIVVRRKMDAFDGKNLGGWIFRITSRTARVNSESSEEAKMKQTNRTSKANEQTTAEDDKPICLERHAVHNLMMAGSDIFSTTSSEQAAPPKTRRMIQAPGGASSNIFS